MTKQDNSPKHGEKKFYCPRCGVFALQLFHMAHVRRNDKESNSMVTVPEYDLCLCGGCDDYHVWANQELVYPDVIIVDDPNDDLPQEIQDDYNEAAKILPKSSRGSAALLRLCIQKICHHLGCDLQKSLNDNIAELVEKGLHPKIIKALDTVRVVGNNAVHPGVLTNEDDEIIAKQLFELVNIIAETMISDEKKIDKLLDRTASQGQQDAIEARNKKATKVAQ